MGLNPIEQKLIESYSFLMNKTLLSNSNNESLVTVNTELSVFCSIRVQKEEFSHAKARDRIQRL